jgi:hypothetical protein
VPASAGLRLPEVLAQRADRRAGPVVLGSAAQPEAPAVARRAAVGARPPVGLAVVSRAAEHGVRPRVAAARAAPSSVGARVPFRAHAPAVARPVPPGVSARQAEALPQAAACEVQPPAVEEVARPDAEAAVAAAQPGVAAAEVAERPDAAEEEAAEPDVALAVAARPAWRAGLPSVPPWAPVWVSRPDLILLWPAPSPSAPIGRAMELMPIAWPSTRSWQAALILVLSCAVGPREVSRGRREGFRRVGVN